MAASIKKRDVSSSSSSDSSDEEESRRLQEAAISFDYFQFPQNCQKPVGPNASLSSDLKHDGINVRYQSSTSKLDGSDFEDNGMDSILGTTPQVRKYLARKLTDKLDREIVFCDPVDSTTPACQQIGVRLFENTPVLYEAVEEQDLLVQPKRRTRQVSSSSTNSSEDERLAAAAVTVEDLERERRMLLRLRPEPQPDTTPLSDRVTYVSIYKQGTGPYSVTDAKSNFSNTEANKASKKKRKRKKSPRV